MNEDKITSKVKARILWHKTHVLTIKDSSVTLLSKHICIPKINNEVEELINPKYNEKGHQNKTKEILCSGVEKAFLFATISKLTYGTNMASWQFYFHDLADQTTGLV